MIAPNASERSYLMRPIMAEPPLCSLADLKLILTLDDLVDLHEVLDLKEAALEQARETRESEIRRDRRR